MRCFRYLPHSEADRKAMLEAIGAKDMEALLATIPERLRVPADLDLAAPQSEPELLASFRRLAAKNLNGADHPCFIGGGAYLHSQPVAVDQLISRGEFFTAYTPYQPEISQGTLQAIFEFQSLVCLLTGMDVAQASLYQGAAAFTEAMLLGARVARKRKKLLVAETIHPHSLGTLDTYVSHLEYEVERVPADPRTGRVDEEALAARLGPDVAAVGVQSPNFYGVIEQQERIAALAHEAGALYVGGFAEPYSLGMLKGPGELGADIAFGEFQAFASGPSFGGPFLGVLGASPKMVRQMPGRIAGETVDADGERGFVLTLSTREQHIRREKATSNVCTNSALMALSATIHLCLLGKEGLAKAARHSRNHAHEAFRRLTAIDGVEPVFSAPFFNEFTLEFPRPTAEVAEALGERGLLGPVPLAWFDPARERQGLFAFTELTGLAEIERLEAALREVL